MHKQVKYKISIAGFMITFIGAVLFSTKAIFVKRAFADTSSDVLTLLTLRMLFSLPFYLIAAYFTSRKMGNVRMNRRQWLYVLGLGLMGYHISSYLDFSGLQFISAGLERLILFLYPTFAVLINAFVFKQNMKRNQKIALLLTYTGIAIAYFGELQIEMSPEFFWGSFLVFLCAVTYSIYIVGGGKLVPVVGSAKFTAYAMLGATVGIFIHFLVAGDYHNLNTGAGLWWYGILLAVVATVIPSFMISEGMKRIGSNNVAIISSIGPVSTILQAHYVLGEKMFMEQVIGTLLVIAGVLLIGWKGN
ncbi:DMT family transporter [Segetibacter sp. 3557_3]|uniref:DMT family transporter n=1 Tax=Segetibacter sp. 3557_3 TaxID=2547429 RepID=UPI00105882B7|nr:DMT family transporter [Segetibacter sp. 3557_3]TDH28747.1 DMT family transporter [Segetibacter sp. 3557_3]